MDLSGFSFRNLEFSFRSEAPPSVEVEERILLMPGYQYVEECWCSCVTILTNALTVLRTLLRYMFACVMRQFQNM